jgi:hypothetical protein
MIINWRFKNKIQNLKSFREVMELIKLKRFDYKGFCEALQRINHKQNKK